MSEGKFLTAEQRVKLKIPELLRTGPGWDAIHLNKFQLRNLDDDEFSWLYYAPGYVINISPQTAKYLERRRRALNLVTPDELPPIPGA